MWRRSSQTSHFDGVSEEQQNAKKHPCSLELVIEERQLHVRSHYPLRSTMSCVMQGSSRLCHLATGNNCRGYPLEYGILLQQSQQSAQHPLQEENNKSQALQRGAEPSLNSQHTCSQQSVSSHQEWLSCTKRVKERRVTHRVP